MTRIKIPFLPAFKKVMFTGVKQCTARTRKFGNVGDTFITFGRTFVLTKVEKVPLQKVAAEYYVSEGTTSANDFVKIWEKLHPRKGFVATQQVWVHWFKEVTK